MMTNKVLNIIKSKNKTSGVTLIALTITIIILLILAGISIATLTGENGIINKAENAKFNTEKGDIENQINIMTTQSVNKKGKLDKEILIGKLQTLPDGKEIVDDDTKIYVIYPDYAFEIDLGSGKTTNTVIEKIEDTTPGELAGNGTKEEPYLIESIEDLVAFSNNVNSGTTYKSKFVKLSRTLDFNSPFSYVNPKTKVKYENYLIIESIDGQELKKMMTIGEGFSPIGIDSHGGFRGNFDGNGKKIKNINICRAEVKYNGLFGCVYDGGYIGNLEVDGNINIVSEKTQILSAGICSSLIGGEISNCYSNVNITVELKAEQLPVGAGGIVSHASGSSKIKNCYNNGKIKVSSYAKRYYGAGAAGICNNMQSGVINNCYNNGEIEGYSLYSLDIGGILGNKDTAMKSNIYNCYNLKDLIDKLPRIGNTLGGIISSLPDSIAIEKCYNKGKILNAIRAGGISVLYQDGGSYKECFYLKGTSNIGVLGREDKIGQAEPLEESQMPKVIDVVQNQIEVDGKMINAWKEDTNNINNGYPILWWQ